MKKMILLSVLFSYSLPLIADDQCLNVPEGERRDNCYASAQAQGSRQGNGNGNGQGNGNNNNLPLKDCEGFYSAATAGQVDVTDTTIATYFVGGNPQPAPLTAARTPQGTTPPTNRVTGVAISNNDNLRYCRGMRSAAANLGADLRSTDSTRSQDGAISCYQKSGITADWESCRSAVGMYNSIKIAEAAMQVFQNVQTNSVQNKAANEAAQRTAAGDGQNAMYDAQTANLNNAKDLNNQQAAAYAAAVAALYSKIQSWIKEDKNTLVQRGCGSGARLPQAPAAREGEQRAAAPMFATPSNTMVFSDKESVPANPENCAAGASYAFDTYRGIVYANKEAKAALTRAAMMFAAKAIAAGIKASQLGAIAKQVQEAKKATEDPYNPATFEFCQVNNNDPRCAAQTTRTSGSGLQDGGFGFGDSFGNNAFSQLGDADTLGNDPLAPLAGNNSVADTSSPFQDDAKKASGILDPAAAASLTPGQGGGAGGGGGGAGAGGGSASLGNDTPGADDSKKESDIKANKADGKYSDASAGGFQAIKPLKEGENPFANLFGDKSGKLEEDRSIASGDIDGQDSGIFAKISKRYGQVQADKRIEAKNLDE